MAVSPFHNFFKHIVNMLSRQIYKKLNFLNLQTILIYIYQLFSMSQSQTQLNHNCEFSSVYNHQGA